MIAAPSIRKAQRTSSNTDVAYLDANELWRRYDDLLVTLAQRQNAKTVAELGGGAKPILADTQRWGFLEHRVAVDISADELAKAEEGVETRVADLCKPIADRHNAYDMVFSNLLCEHLPDARTFHENCFRLLRPGGLAVHFFPTLFTFPYVANLLIPEKAARSLLRKIQPGRIDNPKYEKFPAHDRWCRGPSRRAIRRYESVGFEVQTYQAAFGHYYYVTVPPLHALENAKTRFLMKHPMTYLTSFATVVLRKPA